MTSTQDVKDQVQDTAATGADEGKHLAAVVGEEAQNVAVQAKDQVHDLIDETLGQINDQSRTQLDRLVGTLKDLSTDLESMSSAADSGLATQLTQQIAERSRGISSHLDGREPTEVLDDVRQLARRHPGLFLLGALSAGVVVGRLARGAKQARGRETTAASTTSSTELTGARSSELTSPNTSTAPAYEQPVVAVPSPPVEPTFPEIGGGDGQPTPARASGRDAEDGSGSGPQGVLP